MKNTSDLIILFWVVFGILTAVINISFAIGIYADADDLLKHTGKRTFLAAKEVWALAALLGGVFVAGIYWVIHHSALNPNRINQIEQNNE